MDVDDGGRQPTGYPRFRMAEIVTEPMATVSAVESVGNISTLRRGELPPWPSCP